MPPPDLTEADRAILAQLVRERIAADRFPLSPRVHRLRYSGVRSRTRRPTSLLAVPGTDTPRACAKNELSGKFTKVSASVGLDLLL